ncbi:MAG: hypothetical protein IJK66_03440 [Bacilli bacterium]|nr:hypothetical protein [Bacilli bacterium]
MSIKELINKLFKPKTRQQGLALPTDLVSVPMRDSLDNSKIKELDEYKNSYLKILLQKKHFTSHDISSKDFSQEMAMNFELFGRLVINHDSNYNLDTMPNYEKNELLIKQRVNPIKIQLYIDRMGEMWDETHLQLIALREIYSELGKKLTKDKKEAILNEIYNLTTKYIIFKSNVYAALAEVETYKKEITNDSASNEIDNLVMYHHNVSYYALYFIPDIALEIAKNREYTILDKIAILERELEMYAYNHLKIDDLNKELEEIDKIEKTPSNKQKLLDKINKLEIKFLVLNDYGGHELDLKPLYEVKFDILTIDIVRQNDSPFKNVEGRELKYYENIILDKITTNITGVDSLLNQRLDEDNKKIIEYFVALLKNGDSYNFYIILQDIFKLSLLLSASSDEEMSYFFDNFKINFNKNAKYDFQYHFTREIPRIGISANNTIPLSAVCWLNNLDILIEKQGQGFINEDTNRIVQIYNYFADKETEKTSQYKIPEGITKITLSFYTRNYIIKDEILKKSLGKTLVTPSSLKTFSLVDTIYGKKDRLTLSTDVASESNEIINSNPWFSPVLHASNVIFNEGLEYIYEPSFIGCTTQSLTIPSTLRNADESAIAYAFSTSSGIQSSIYELIFTNYENSITLHDNEQMDNIIKRLFDISFLYELSMLSDIVPIISPRIQKIVLVSKDGERIQILINEIIASNLSNNESDPDKIISEIKKEIYEIVNNTKEENKSK